MLRIGVFVILLFLEQFSFAQKSKILFSANFNNSPFQEFVNEIEKQCGAKVFYLTMIPDSFKVNFSCKNMLLDSALSIVLKQTGINYFISEEKNIILLKDYSIIGNFPDRFNQVEKVSDIVVPIQKEKQILPEPEEKIKPEVYGIISHTIGTPGTNKSGKCQLSGYIRNEKNGEALIGAAIYCQNLKSGVTTNEYGYYTITLSVGTNDLVFTSLGMKKSFRKVTIYSNGQLNIEMPEAATALSEVVILGDKKNNISDVQMGVSMLSSKMIKRMPVALGEADVLKSLLLLPGVQAVGEGASGFNVRGGNTDQNLFLLDDAPIYNTSHFFGFFSSINNDAIKDAKLYKSGIPSKFGGKISSVLDMNVKEGNKKQFDFNGGISPIACRLTLEGPIVKDKISVIMSGRSTYSNWILKKIPDDKISKSRASFYDLTGKLSYNVNSKNNISFTGYYSQDKFNFVVEENYAYVNEASTFKWKHIFTQNLFYVFTGTYSDYSYNLDNKKENLESRTMFGIQNIGIKNDFTYLINKKHKFEFGLQFDKTDLYPASIKPLTEGSIVLPKAIETEHSIQPVLYFNETWDPIDKLSFSAGLRYSSFSLLGPKTIFTYSPDRPRIATFIIDTLTFGNNKIVKNYAGLDYRFSGRYSINNNFSVKASYNRIFQYFFILSNTTTISPTDIWKSSDYHLSPEIGDQYSLGVYWNMDKNNFNCSIEGYYKSIKNLIEYKGGAELLLNEHIETDLTNSIGKSYGVEFLVEKNIGKLNGWISYAYSRSLSKTTGKYMDEIINGGRYFPSNFDKPHAISLVANYSFSRRATVSGDCTYSTGRPITYPVAIYQIDGMNRVLYINRNEDRIPDYLRLDASVTIEGNLKIRKIFHGTWILSVYNVIGRNNAYSEFFKTDNNNLVHAYKLSVFNRPIFTITYNFKYYSI